MSAFAQQFCLVQDGSGREQVKVGGQEKDLFIINSGHAVLSHNVTGKASYRTGLAPPKHTKCAGMLFSSKLVTVVPDRLSPNDKNKPHMNPVFSACRGGGRESHCVGEELAPNLLCYASTYPRHLAKNDDRDPST